MKQAKRSFVECARHPWQMAGVEKGTPVLLALSGGADSACLLHLLAGMSAEDGFSLTAAHLNHGIRGAEADRDEAFCRSLAQRYGVELVTRTVDVPTLAKASGRGLEETARAERYRFFEDVMQQRGIGLLVTAHHADDQAETVLFRLSRGTGLSGLCGIPPVRKLEGGYLVRPLLGISKQEILAFCRENGIEYVTDSTNADPSYARNRIRLRVLPELEQVNPSLRENVARMTEHLAADADYLEGITRAFLQEHERCGRIGADALRALHPAIRCRVYAALSPCRLSAVHLQAVDDLLQRGLSGSSCALPSGYKAFLQGGELFILPELSGELLRHPFCEGSFSLCDGSLTVSVRKVEKFDKEKKVHNLSTTPHIFIGGDFDIMLENLFWRTRRPGDTLTVHGVNREVRRLYREAGIPPAVRSSMPLLCDEKGVLWAPFAGVRDDLARIGGGEGYLAEVMLPCAATRKTTT